MSYRTLQKELDGVKKYLQSESEWLDGKLDWECKIDPETDTSIQIPAMLIQGFVEPAIRNGISRDTGPGEIEITVHRTSLGILIIITDNGNLRYHDYKREHSAGIRLELLDHHIRVFNREQPYSISYQVLDIAYCEPGQSGTRVLITIVL